MLFKVCLKQTYLWTEGDGCLVLKEKVLNWVCIAGVSIGYIEYQMLEVSWPREYCRCVTAISVVAKSHTGPLLKRPAPSVPADGAVALKSSHCCMWQSTADRGFVRQWTIRVKENCSKEKQDCGAQLPSDVISSLSAIMDPHDEQRDTRNELNSSTDATDRGNAAGVCAQGRTPAPDSRSPQTAPQPRQ